MKSLRFIVPLVLFLVAASRPVQAATHLLYVDVEEHYPELLPVAGEVREVVVPPRFRNANAMLVGAYDSQGTLLSSYTRTDLRLATREGQTAIPRPDGSRLLLSVEVVGSLRWVRAYTREGDLVMEYDAGPALVNACTSGELPPELCSTFDSDGDGCNDNDDDAPLVPETAPPVVSGTVSPAVLWPPNHHLVDVTTEVTTSDNCTASPTLVLESVVSSDPESGVTQGDQGPDIVGADLLSLDLAFQLRAERWRSRGSSRVYTVTYRSEDIAGNVGRLVLSVLVPVSGGYQ